MFVEMRRSFCEGLVPFYKGNDNGIAPTRGSWELQLGKLIFVMKKIIGMGFMELGNLDDLTGLEFEKSVFFLSRSLVSLWNTKFQL